jgi:hypothetical protein
VQLDDIIVPFSRDKSTRTWKRKCAFIEFRSDAETIECLLLNEAASNRLLSGRSPVQLRPRTQRKRIN